MAKDTIKKPPKTFYDAVKYAKAKLKKEHPELFEKPSVFSAWRESKEGKNG